MSIAAAFAADKEPAPFRPAPATAFAHRQANAQVTIGAEPYAAGDEKVKIAFGKLDPYQLGVLPVLIAVQNDSGKAIRLDRLQAEYVGPDRKRVDSTPASDVKYLQGPNSPKWIPGPGGKKPIVLKPKKNPLNAWEIEGRALTAQMLPPGQSASGFLYFQTGLQRGALIYLSGITEAGTGKELLYFEIPLE